MGGGIGLHNANAQTEGITEEEYEVVSLPGLKTPDGNYMLEKVAPVCMQCRRMRKM